MYRKIGFDSCALALLIESDLLKSKAVRGFEWAKFAFTDVNMLVHVNAEIRDLSPKRDCRF